MTPTPVAKEPVPQTPRPVMPPPTGRVVPPTLRLRVEDPRTGQAPPAPPRRPMLVRPPAPATPQVPQAPTGNLSRPPGARPGSPGAPGVAARAPQRPMSMPPRPGPVGGPRPLPSQPIRPAAPGPRPGAPAYRPPIAKALGTEALRTAARSIAAAAGDDERPVGTAADHADDHARRRHDGRRSRDQARCQGQGRAQEAPRAADDDDDQQHARRRDSIDDRAGVRRRRQDAVVRRGNAAGRSRGHQPGRPGDARTGRHRHGSRRPRQDDAARCDPIRASGRARSRRHHSAHRRLLGARQRSQRRVPRHAGPRSVHDDARARRPRHRRCGAGRGGRRRRDAADQGSDRSRACGRRADPRGDQQDRQAGRQPGSRQEGALRSRSRPRAVGRPDRHGRSLGEEEAESRVAARNGAARDRDERAQGQPETERVGHGARSEVGQGPRTRCDDPGAGRHAPRRRYAHRRDHRREGARAHRRSRPPAEERGAGDAGRSARPRRPAPARRRVPGAVRHGQRRARSPCSGRPRPRKKPSAARALGSRSNRCSSRSPKAA